MPESEKELRRNIFRELLPYYGKLVRTKFFQKNTPCITAVERENPVIKGSCRKTWSAGVTEEISEEYFIAGGITIGLCYLLLKKKVFKYLRMSPCNSMIFELATIMII